MTETFTEDEFVENAPLYALGALDAPEARQFEAHLAGGCQACQAELGSFTPVIEALALSPEIVAPAESVRRRLLSSVRRDAESRSKQPIPTPVTELLTIRHNEGEWREIFAGVFRKHLFADKTRGTVTSLFRMAPGSRVPVHAHSGAEECLVLEGDLQMYDLSLGPGDYHLAPAGSVHNVLSTTGGALFMIVGPAN